MSPLISYSAVQKSRTDWKVGAAGTPLIGQGEVEISDRDLTDEVALITDIVTLSCCFKGGFCDLDIPTDQLKLLGAKQDETPEIFAFLLDLALLEFELGLGVRPPSS